MLGNDGKATFVQSSFGMALVCAKESFIIQFESPLCSKAKKGLLWKGSRSLNSVTEGSYSCI